MNGNTNSGPGVSPRRGIGKRLIAPLAALGLVAGAAGAVVSSTPGSNPSAAAADLTLVSLPGHVHRLARGGVDAGEAPDATRMHGLDLVLAKTPAQGKALDQ